MSKITYSVAQLVGLYRPSAPPPNFDEYSEVVGNTNAFKPFSYENISTGKNITAHSHSSQRVYKASEDKVHNSNKGNLAKSQIINQNSNKNPSNWLPTKNFNKNNGFFNRKDVEEEEISFQNNNFSDQENVYSQPNENDDRNFNCNINLNDTRAYMQPNQGIQQAYFMQPQFVNQPMQPFQSFQQNIQPMQFFMPMRPMIGGIPFQQIPLLRPQQMNSFPSYETIQIPPQNFSPFQPQPPQPFQPEQPQQPFQPPQPFQPQQFQTQSFQTQSFQTEQQQQFQSQQSFQPEQPFQPQQSFQANQQQPFQTQSFQPEQLQQSFQAEQQQQFQSQQSFQPEQPFQTQSFQTQSFQPEQQQFQSQSFQPEQTFQPQQSFQANQQQSFQPEQLQQPFQTEQPLPPFYYQNAYNSDGGGNFPHFTEQVASFPIDDQPMINSYQQNLPPNSNQSNFIEEETHFYQSDQLDLNQDESNDGFGSVLNSSKLQESSEQFNDDFNENEIISDAYQTGQPSNDQFDNSNDDQFESVINLPSVQGSNASNNSDILSSLEPEKSTVQNESRSGIEINISHENAPPKEEVHEFIPLRPKNYFNKFSSSSTFSEKKEKQILFDKANNENNNSNGFFEAKLSNRKGNSHLHDAAEESDALALSDESPKENEKKNPQMEIYCSPTFNPQRLNGSRFFYSPAHDTKKSSNQ